MAARLTMRHATIETVPAVVDDEADVNPARSLFDAACVRAIDRVGGAHDQGFDPATWRIPADRVEEFVAALKDELGDAWQVRWAADQSARILYVEHSRPVGITHVRFTDSTVPGCLMKDLTCTHYY